MLLCNGKTSPVQSVRANGRERERKRKGGIIRGRGPRTRTEVQFSIFNSVGRPELASKHCTFPLTGENKKVFFSLFKKRSLHLSSLLAF